MFKRALTIRYSTLFVSLLLLIFLLTLSVDGEAASILTLILFTQVGISGVYVAASKKRDIIIAVAIAIPWVVAIWIAFLLPDLRSLPLDIASLGLAMLFFGYTVYLILRHIMYAKKVTADLLFGAVNVYLMLGCIWALLYRIIQMIEPDAFASSYVEAPYDYATMMYYSFTTLTTLGYGDILPANDLSRTVAIIEAVTGVLYTTILVARLMGIYLAGFLSRPDKD